MKLLTYLFIFMMISNLVFSQQIADTTYLPSILNPAYQLKKGSVVFIDEGHHNFHKKDGRYKAFSNLLERDGYNVKAYEGVFEKSKLAKGKILVISNALNKINVRNWYLPTPSAFTKEEIEVVKEWLSQGGNLFLIADHMPMAGAAKNLAEEFGFEFTNGFVLDTISRGPAYFNIKDETLVESILTTGRNANETVQQVATFTGQAFKIPQDATAILVFNEKYVNLLPDTAWIFDKNTRKYNVKGYSQGAFKKYKNGKVVVFGEAAMFTAQLAGPNKTKMGMSRDDAQENYKLLLNIIHWLDGKLE